MREERLGHRLTVEPYTQWEPGVSSPGSACGPATMAALIEYWHTRRGCGNIPGISHFSSKAAHINYIYSRHGGTPWGMSARGFARGLKAYLSAALAHEKHRRQPFSVSVFNDMQRYRAEIDAERPVAVKFDKWFSMRWRGRYAYDYHWVLGTGYESADTETGPVLIVQDNGIRHKNGGFTPGRERRIPYLPNQSILTMVALDIGEAAGTLPS
ncbi:C39 family peptidase [Paenibacillus sp. S150]|uniref:C39 family peptidase n=1 Tax=Paenibacillus sp. S150 TaxID=2749826 RepID=UPI001C5747D4|nr:C39 family peptidase [Paenibacillus sp. S150]MBW4085389.1 C39 family peptidase [Paenibacillus sp. S150]